MRPFTTYSLPESKFYQTEKNAAWLLFLLDQDMTPTQKELLEKIATALRADFEQDVHVVRLEPADNISLIENGPAGARLILSFGVLPAQVGVWIDLQHPGICFLESFTFILTLPLQALEQNGNAKKELWKNMQGFLEMNTSAHE